MEASNDVMAIIGTTYYYYVCDASGVWIVNC